MKTRKLMMEHLQVVTIRSDSAQKDAAQHIYSELLPKNFFSGAKNFLLLSGGSCIAVAESLVRSLPANVTLHHTTVALADERWVEPGSPDSNEKQLRDAGVLQLLEAKGAQFVSMLGIDSNPSLTTAQLDTQYRALLRDCENKVLLAGIGEDGHTLGILPDEDLSRFLSNFSTDPHVVYYELPTSHSNPFKKRVTATFSVVSKLTETFIFGIGDAKKDALMHLQKKDTAIHTIPALGLYLSEHQPTLLTDIQL